MKKCSHIDIEFQEFNQNTDTEELNRNTSYLSRIEKICSFLIELNQTGKYQNQTENEDSYTNCKYLNCEQCQSLNDRSSLTRLHLCATCLTIGCFSPIQNSHIKQHSLTTNHSITIDITYAAFYCFKCKDFQYNQDIEEFLRESFSKEKYLPHGKFSEWEPSQRTLKLLKKITAINNSNKLNISPQITNNYSFSILKSFKLKTSSIIGLRGLINLGNTCFMNCILQTLTHIPSLRDYFLGDQHFCTNKNTHEKILNPNSFNLSNYSNNNNKIVCLVCEIVTLFQEFYSGKRSPYIPFRLLHQVWTQVKHLAGYEQQDAHEFFIAALNTIHKNFIQNDINCMNLNKDRKKFINYNNCNCIIDKIFTGGLQSDVVCSNCNNISTTVDPFWDISLDVHKNTGKSMKHPSEPLKLEDCLLKFTLPEVLTSFNCSNCKLSREARKQFTMKKLPIVCCFHLKRFEQSNRVHKKIFDHVSFPEILDMSPFTSNTLTNSKKSFANGSEIKIEGLKKLESISNGDEQSNKYFLFSVVNHHGTLESGHYTSFIRLKNEQWFKCDDHIISKASLNDVMNSEGYLLFYHKIWNDYE